MELLVKVLADGLLVVLLMVAGFALMRWTSKRVKLVSYPYVIMAGLTSLLVGKLMSLVYQPAVARPFMEKGTQAGAAYIDNPGFPSDHILLATVAVLAVTVLVKKRWLTVVMVAVIAAIGVGRVLALVHTPLDIVGGIIAGLSGGLWYYVLTNSKER